MRKTFFDLTENSDISNLSIKKINSWDCRVFDDENRSYDGFVLSKNDSGSILVVCECEFSKPVESEKFAVRLTFSKVNDQFELIHSGSNRNIQISFKELTDRSYSSFWKMISFLFRWKDRLNFSDFDDFLSLFSISEEKVFGFLDSIDSENPKEVMEILQKIPLEKLDNFEDLVSISRLRELLSIRESNKNNYSEDFWQGLFEKYPRILSQIFSYPYIKVGEESEQYYCGGMGPNGRGGVYTDFEYSSLKTGNLAFIEIKTPKEDLLVGSQYRGNDEGGSNVVHSMSPHLTGGVNQVLNQKKSFLEEMSGNSEYSINDPKCILIVGVLPNTEKEIKSFELYRSSLGNVTVITFDELFGRIEGILKIFESFN